MFESKDASKSDERQVKNTSNPLTRKRKGETHKMGDRCMLKTFFVISLMLVAAAFSTTAMAADGDGTATVGWSNSRTAADGTVSVFDATDASAAGGTDSETLNTPPLRANSQYAAVKITYTVGKTSADQPDEDEVDMAGGVVRVSLPGWAMGQIDKDDADTRNANEKGIFKHVTIMVDPGVAGDGDAVTLYSTDADGFVDTFLGVQTGGTPLSKSAVNNLLDRVKISKDRVEVRLGDGDRTVAGSADDWATGGTLTIVLGDITTGIPTRLLNVDGSTNEYPYANYQFTTSSRTKNGNLARIDAQPNVRVGNIVGTATGIDKATKKLEFTVTPTHVYPGEKKREIAIAFTAPGPMYSGDVAASVTTMLINLPHGIRPTDAKTIRVSGTGITTATGTVATRTVNDAGDTVDIDEIPSITLTFGKPPNGVNKGQKVVVRYTVPMVYGVEGTDANTATTVADYATKSSFMVGDATTNGSIITTIQSATAASDGTQNAHSITGGAIRPLPDSGTAEIGPVAVTVGALRRDITVTYTAATALKGYDIKITPDGLVIEGDDKLQEDEVSSYGYVSGDMPERLAVIDGAAIQWRNVTLKKGEELTAKVRRVDITDEPNDYTWLVQVAANNSNAPAFTDTGIEKSPILSVVKTADNPVRFQVEGDTTFPAGSEQTIKFRFIADATPIRDGKVTMTIPGTLGSAPKPQKSKQVGQIKVTGPGVAAADVSVSGPTITIIVDMLPLGKDITVEYGTTSDSGKKAVLGYMSDDYNVTGTFRAAEGVSTRSLTPIKITLGNIEDGLARTSATQSPVTLSTSEPDATVKAGSRIGNTIEVTFTAAGTMDGGHVSLELPTSGEWGLMQTDPQQPNYVTTNPVPGGDLIESLSVEASGRRAVAKIKKLARDQSFKFVYGGGTVPDNNGVTVQNSTGIASFMVKSDGDGDEVFAKVKSKFVQSSRDKFLRPDKQGKIHKDDDGVLRIKVTSAQDGTGDVAFTDSDGEPKAPDVRAADDSVQLIFTYTPTQTIENGELKFTAPGNWSPPQVEDIGVKGYTEVTGPGLGSASAAGQSVTVPIFLLDKEDTIMITYGASSDAAGKVMAATATGSAAFKFAVKGAEEGQLKAIRPATLTVGPQRSGKGKAVVTPTGDTLHAGDADREIKVVYTAAGQMVAGQVQLTIPTGWSAPTAESVTAMIGTTAATPTFSDQMITVDGVSVLAGGTVTFVYTGMVQPEKKDGVAFAVKSHGGLATDSLAAVSGMDTVVTVDVQEARAGSGMGTVSPKIVTPGDTGVDLTFTYTAIGQIDPPREFRVRIPTSWGAPSPEGTFVDNTNTYTVEHRDSSGGVISAIVEELPPIGQEMVARVRIGGLNVEAGDQIVFIYENVDAPAASEVSAFQLSFDGRSIADSVQVRVQDSMPSMLSLQSHGTVSADEGAMLGITVGLADDDGNAVAMENDTTVTLGSSSATGAFSMMADEAGTASPTVTIAGGDVSAMVYYTDSTAGTATITASAPDLTMATHEVTVTAAAVDPTAVAITSVMVDPTLAKDGDTVTVTAMATAGQTPMVTIGSLVTDGAMVESPAGTYTRTDTLAAGTQEGAHSVSVSIGDVMMSATDMLTIDNTAPTVTVTAPESAANGDTVMISATVMDASAISSVMADVSMLDSTQTDMVELTMGDDGYSASITISADNENANGSKTVTVTAMDDAGNSGMGEATVELKNTLSYTSMIPAGISLYHVPLDVEGLDTVADLKMKLGDAVTLVIVYDHATGSWNSRSDDVMITADLGVVLSMASATTLTLEGEAWDDGASMISLQAGPNLVGLPVNDPKVTNVSDIAGLFDEGVVSTITVSTDDGFELASDTMDPAVMGDAAYLVTASAAATAILLGDGWSYSAAGAAPIALAGFSVDGQTPVLDVQGAVVDEITGLAKEGFRVKVKNLSTKASLSKVTSVETAEGYNMTFVDLKAGNAARIGDILEISADSPSPLIGVQPVRHIVTANDVKSGILELENLIAYEIPAETELLRNYPNPFNPETWIPYHLAEDADVRLTIYSVNGEVVRDIDVGHQTAAKYDSRSKAIYWDGRNRFGEQVASGIYFYSLSAGDFSATRKMVILK